MKEIGNNSWRTAVVLLLALFAFCPAPYAQDSNTFYVNVSNATPVAPFTNWQTAATNIQDAILFANDGDTVVVTNGVYNERIDFMGKAIVVSSEEGPGVTIIDGNQSGSVVTFSGGEGMNSIIQGFTITNGYAAQGGGIYCTNAAPVISNCFVFGNSTLAGTNTDNPDPCAPGNNGGDGAGIYAWSNSYPVITDCVISNNTTGGAEQNGFGGNGGNGGGIFCYSATIVKSLISGNSTGAGGSSDRGGIMAETAEMALAFGVNQRLSRDVALLPTGPAVEGRSIRRAVALETVVTEEESVVIPPLYGTALFSRTPQEAAHPVMSELVVSVEGEVAFIAAAQQWLIDARFP